jgi:Meiotically Up-regulated Gene 113 (MUG113) protein
MKEQVAHMVAHDGAVYCVGPSDARRIKIGWASEPLRRVRTLQCGSADDLVIHGFLPGSRSLERGLHDAFADRRLRGEWFDNSDGEITAVFTQLFSKGLNGDFSE